MGTDWHLGMTPKFKANSSATLVNVAFVIDAYQPQTADHGILSGRGIPARRTRAMRTWVLSIVIGYTIICTKIAILALGD